MAALTLAGESWSSGATAGVLFGTLLVAALCQVGFGRANAVMFETGGVRIVGFEMIRSWDRAVPLVERWRTSRRGWRAARRSLVVDVPFVVAYGLGLWLLASVVAHQARERGWTGWAVAAASLGIAFVVAAALDMIENLALALVLYCKKGFNWPLVAFGCAVVKVVLLGVGGLALITLAVAFLGP